MIESVELPNQVRLQYVEQGDPSGIGLVLLHGLADSWRTFERVLAHLPSSIHAFALTQRGHGDADKPEDGYGTRDFVDDLARFMDAVGLEAAVIVGGSSGGFAARRFAIDHPGRTLGLVLLGSPLSLGEKPAVREMFDSTIATLTDPIDPGFVGDFAESTLAQPIPAAFLDTIVAENLKAPARVWKAVSEGLLEDDSAKELRRIKAPTLIVWGDQDTILARSEEEAMAAAIPTSRLVVYEGVGHSCYWEEPERIAADLAAFVESIVS